MWKQNYLLVEFSSIKEKFSGTLEITFYPHLPTDSSSQHSFIISGILSGDAELLIELVIVTNEQFTDSFKVSLFVQ